MPTDVLGAARPDPDTVRQGCRDLVMRITGAAEGCILEWGLAGERLVTAWCRIAGPDRRMLDPPSEDPRRADPRKNRRFIVQDREIHFTVYDRGEHVAWIGVARAAEAPPFGRREQRRLVPWADVIADALIRVRAQERATAAPGSCDVVLGPGGSIECVSDPGHPVIRNPTSRAGLVAWARAIDGGGTAHPPQVDGHTARWCILHGGGGTMLRLLHLEPIAPLLLAPTSALSPAQREVADLAAAGATAPEIAQMLKLSPSTVRTHLRLIYQSLEVCSRAELARLVG